ncbi:MAG: WecB/TagA/CpsF family glycosyltransferase [Bacteroidota bacterium]
MNTTLYNVRLNILNTGETIERCNLFLNGEKTRTLFFINAHCFNTAQKNDEYREALNGADLVLNDGIGISIASKIAGVKVKENMNGTDFIPKLLGLANEKKMGVYFLGGEPGIARIAAKRIQRSIPGIKISGYNHGYNTNNVDVINKINHSGARLLICGMGVPLQELWIMNNKDYLKNVTLAVAGGAILDFLSGKVSRAPLYLRNMQLEWIYRLSIEPRRLWKRYLLGNFVFLCQIISFKLNLKRYKKPKDIALTEQ